MSRPLTLLVLMLAMICQAEFAAAQAPFEKPEPRTSQGRAGGSLTPPSTASPRAILALFLRSQGRDQTVTDSLVEGARSAGRDGISHVQFSQRVNGLPVYGTYARAAFSVRGELLNLVDNLQPIPPFVRGTSLTEQQAIGTAIAELYPDAGTPPPSFFHRAPAATRVAIPHGDGAMSTGYVVETWTRESNQLHETLVDGNGAVLYDESRTANDSYNVFTISPLFTAQQVVAGPGTGNSQSPIGWLDGGNQGSTHITGNNARAYLDAIANNQSDDPGSTVTNGDFLATADLAASPTTNGNRDVAVQNLFYFNNVIHDALYRFGFTEAAGNFQQDNLGKGGAGGDPVNAEAQDGSGTDNANFATPSDGSSPRMQMFLWTPPGLHEVIADTDTFPATQAAFGTSLNTTGVSGEIRTTTPADGCSSMSGLSGAIALIDRGTCDFTVKVKNAQSAGAVGVIVANNAGNGLLVMGGRGGGIRIPAVFIGQDNGTTLKGSTPVAGTVRLAPNPPPQLDSAIDGDIVFHEYCHGLTWRMIGGMSGPMAGAVGEGMSDVCAALLTNDDAIGEYSSSTPNGIRRERYANYGVQTYGDITGSEVHDDGELYAAIGWKAYELFLGAGLSADDLLTHMVDGMNYTPSTPKFEHMRDGILAAIGGGSAPALAPGNRACLVWNAFAQYGVGVGASAVVRGKRVTVSESFTKPPACN